MILLFFTNRNGIALRGGLKLATITGSIYNGATGEKCVTGRLTITPRTFAQNNHVYFVTNAVVVVDVPMSGDLSFDLAPSYDRVTYDVEFDPSPLDTDTPLSMKSGYFRDKWSVPDVEAISIHEL